MRQTVRSSERGAALITVLLIIAAMSVVAVGLTQIVSQATQRARLLDAQAQLRFHAVSAEQVAISHLGGLIAQVGGRLSEVTPGLGEAQIFPIEGGQVTVVARDASNCFNVNSLVLGRPETELTGEDKAIVDFREMVEEAGFDPGEASALTSALVDWMDSDNVPGPSGAEDAFYLGELPAYRTSGQPLADLSELRAIRGFHGAPIQALEPLICVREVPVAPTRPSLNINTLQPEQAPLLVLAFSGALRIDEARRVIAARPTGGWPELEAFLEEPEIANIAPDSRRLEMLSTVSRYMEVRADVAYRGQTMSLKILLEAQPGENVRTLRRERIG